MAASPRFKARLAGALYLLEGATSAFGQVFVVGSFVVPGQASATANRILANESMYQLAITAGLLAVAFATAKVVVFYDLFSAVSPPISRLAAYIGLVAIVLDASSSVIQAAALPAVHGGQINLALSVLNWRTAAFDIYLAFFGLQTVVYGYLIARSEFLPRALGVLLALAGLGYMTLFSAPLGRALYPYYLAPAGVAEPATMLWLLIVGLNPRKWQEQGERTAARSGPHGLRGSAS